MKCYIRKSDKRLQCSECGERFYPIKRALTNDGGTIVMDSSGVLVAVVDTKTKFKSGAWKGEEIGG